MSFQINCTCGCGQVVEAVDSGFHATTVEMEACENRKGFGMVSLTVRKSAAYAAAVPTTVLRHRDGLVTFG